ncbi:hypothetical protein BV25DRAFT_1920614 [Artomyces pyxidatus]|uniref:Uncharacterized protein n=1 Tax=Artomyces pyxidatus TaxID=48021 RepID=A0ACB8SKB0_9AGAM|nr:hypothetical protein BV25DRAFT_1920614 [Artomyces pyxidatus]
MRMQHPVHLRRSSTNTAVSGKTPAAAGRACEASPVARLTASLLPPNTTDPTKCAGALASLRHDAGLQALLPYLVCWVGGVLSTLLHFTLPPSYSRHLRTSAASTLLHILTQHSTMYASLSPCIMKTLLLALLSPDKNCSTRAGAIWGLVGIGKEAVRKGLVEAGGAHVAALKVLQALLDRPVPLDMRNEADALVVTRLRGVLGDVFAERLMGDTVWVRSKLGDS